MEFQLKIMETYEMKQKMIKNEETRKEKIEDLTKTGISLKP